MKQRFWLFKRGKTFYVQDSATGEQKSLGTKDRGEANRLLELKRQSQADPGFRQLLLRTCLGSDSMLATRTWQAVMDQMIEHGKESTQARCSRAVESKWFDRIRKTRLIETTAEQFLAVLNSCPCSINHYLRRLHNLALGLGWLPFPVLPPKLWPKPRFGEKRAITRAEHERILAAEKNRERNLFYQLLWEIGAAQSDAASLKAEQIDWSTRVLSFQRMKTGTWSYVVIGKGLERILTELPREGPLFPSLAAVTANDRAAEFYRRCKLLEIKGISLHSYRYSWAERAKQSGYPERFAQEALGHDSKAVHRAYARRARTEVPPLDEFEHQRSNRLG
ncbi:MAG: tyrosine-type recombinase/integrase [Verrucomicrobiia bacterium]